MAFSSTPLQFTSFGCNASTAVDSSTSKTGSDSFGSLHLSHYQREGQGSNQAASFSPPFAGLSVEFCSAVFGLKSSVSMVSSSSELLQTQCHDVTALGRARRFVYVSIVTHKQRLRSTCGGAVGLAVQRAMAPATMSSKYSHQMMICIMRRVAAKRAAATLEGATQAENIFFSLSGKPEHFQRVFELSAIGADMGCPHNKGVLGCCYAYGRGVGEDRVWFYDACWDS